MGEVAGPALVFPDYDERRGGCCANVDSATIRARLGISDGFDEPGGAEEEGSRDMSAHPSDLFGAVRLHSAPSRASLLLASLQGAGRTSDSRFSSVSSRQSSMIDEPRVFNQVALHKPCPDDERILARSLDLSDRNACSGAAGEMVSPSPEASPGPSDCKCCLGVPGKRVLFLTSKFPSRSPSKRRSETASSSEGEPNYRPIQEKCRVLRTTTV